MSQIEDYRAKAKEYAHLTAVTKSLREGRRYRQLAETYRALALGQEGENVQPPGLMPKTSFTQPPRGKNNRCPKCGLRVTAPYQSAYLTAGVVEHQWACQHCNVTWTSRFNPLLV
jgi:hypothetical protein